MKQVCTAFLLLLAARAGAQAPFNATLLDRVRPGQTAGEVTSVLGEPTRALAQPGYLAYSYRFAQSRLELFFDSLQQVEGFVFQADSASVQPIGYATSALLRKGLSRAGILQQLGTPLVMNVKGNRSLLLYRNGAERVSISYADTSATGYEFSYSNDNRVPRTVPVALLQQLKLRETGTEAALRLLGTPSRIVAGNNHDFWYYEAPGATVSLQFGTDGKLAYYQAQRSEGDGTR